MTLPVISVIIPTIDGREKDLARCIAGYKRDAGYHYQLDLVVVRNEPSCGWGWAKGAEQISDATDYVHFSCDDLEPQPGWAPGAMLALRHKIIPAPRVLNGHTGAPEFFPGWGVEWENGVNAPFACVPFIDREGWDGHVAPMLTTHYFGDNFVTFRAERAGYSCRVVRGYFFKHFWAEHGRGAGMGYGERLEADRRLFLEAVEMVQRGEWKQPWPEKQTDDD